MVQVTSKNAADCSLVLHDFVKLLAKGKGEGKEEANRQLGGEEGAQEEEGGAGGRDCGGGG